MLTSAWLYPLCQFTEVWKLTPGQKPVWYKRELASLPVWATFLSSARLVLTSHMDVLVHSDEAGMLFKTRAHWRNLQLEGPEAGLICPFCSSTVFRLPYFTELSVNLSPEHEVVVWRNRNVRVPEFLYSVQENQLFLLTAGKNKSSETLGLDKSD